MKLKKLDFEVFERGVSELVGEKEVKNIIASGRKLRVKHGIDATSPDLHLGHAANLWKLREFQEAGHKAVLLLGDVTTRIGDPTGRRKARPVLAEKIISENIRSLKRQAERILLPGHRIYEFHRSSEWYGNMPSGEFLSLLSLVTHARLIERDMFQERIKAGEEIYLHEFVYPILQGYDSVALRSDLTVIGSDQLFNEHLGRFLQEKFGQKPQGILALKILPGLDGGEKMSKSRDNFIGLNDSPQDKFGKTMRLLDELVIDYMKSYTALGFPEINRYGKSLQDGGNPMAAKLVLAESIVARYHGKEVSQKEMERFLSIFSKRDFKDVPSVSIRPGARRLLDLLTELHFAPSRTEARRLTLQGAVEINKKVVRDPAEIISVEGGMLVRVGKKRITRLKASPI